MPVLVVVLLKPVVRTRPKSDAHLASIPFHIEVVGLELDLLTST